MSGLVAAPSDDMGERRRRTVTAMLRAAYAWSARWERPEAMREVARMTGFVMEAHGPGNGPVTPLALLDALHRPLGELPLLAGADESDNGALRDVVLLEPGEDGGDRLSAAAHDLVCEHVVPLDSQADEHGWLPSWTRMSADQIRARAFAAMAGPKNQHLYEVSRRLLIEHPAGLELNIQDEVSKSGARIAPGGYQAIPESALFPAPDGGAWWWPCPDCRWPMAVMRDRVQCRYRPHSAVFEVGRRGTRSPTLTRIDEGHGARTPRAERAEGSVCVGPGIWRFIVVPGASELRIAAYLEKLGAEVELWPQMDAYDLHLAIAGTVLRLDVKEYRSQHRLIAELRARPPAAQVQVLLPRTHEHQAEAVKAALPGIVVTTERRLIQQVRRIMKKLEKRKDGDR